VPLHHSYREYSDRTRQLYGVYPFASIRWLNEAGRPSGLAECPLVPRGRTIKTSTEPTILGLAAVIQGGHAFDFVENIDEVF
jgi:hypothetical protein